MALAAALEPFADLCLEFGITSPEMERLLRGVFVRRAEQLLFRNSPRTRSASDTRIALIIGVHRNFVRKIRTTKPRAQLDKVQHRHRGAALLEAWTTDWQFLTAAGYPRDLPIRSSSEEPSFEMLVRRHMSGVSLGTAIAELRRFGAIRLLPDEQIRLRSRSAKPSGITAANISTMSERVGQLASTLLHNLKAPQDQRLSEGLAAVWIDQQRLPFVRQTLMKRARAFLDGLTAELSDEVATSKERARRVQLGLMVFGYENNET